MSKIYLVQECALSYDDPTKINSLTYENIISIFKACINNDNENDNSFVTMYNNDNYSLIQNSSFREIIKCVSKFNNMVDIYDICYDDNIDIFYITLISLNADYITDEFIFNINSLSQTDSQYKLLKKTFKKIFKNHQKFINSRTLTENNIFLKNNIIKYTSSYLYQQMIDQPSFLNTKLYKYQRANIKYMLDREENKNYMCIPESDAVIVNHKYEYNCNYNKFEPIFNNIMKLEIVGGCLCDDVGLGKTIQLITLCLLSNLRTLIVVPKHLKQHWINEFNKHVKNINQNTFNVYKYKKPITSNILLVTSNELNAYFKQHFCPQRIIIDEFHEMSEIHLRQFYSLETNVIMWLVTATPFVNNVVTDNIISLTTKKENNTEINNVQYLSKYKEYINEYAKLFRINTKNSVKQELNMPSVTHYKYYVSLSYDEQCCYDVMRMKCESTNRLKIFCVNPNIDEEFIKGIDKKQDEFITINDVKKKFIEYHTSIINASVTDINILIKQKDNNIKKFIQEQLITETNKKKINDNVKNYTAKMEIYYNELARPFETKKKNSQLALNILKTKIDEIMNYDSSDSSSDSSSSSDDSDVGEICAICMDKLCKGKNVVILSCGHIYCALCYNSIQNTYKCPTCMTNLKNLYIVNTKLKENVTKNINTCGTKISLIMDLIKTKKITGKIIIYSSWNRCLRYIHDVFNKNEIYTLYPYTNDNLYSHIEKFKNDVKWQVLLLSSDCNASGLNIQYAENVILINPIEGNYIYRKQIVNQIIGRMHRIGQMSSNVNFIEIITKNTIEFDIDKENKINDSIYDDYNDDVINTNVVDIT